MARIRQAAVGALVLIAAVGCGTQVVSTVPPKEFVELPAQPALATTSQDTNVILEDVDRWFSSWAGGRAEQQAAAVVWAYYQNGGVSECLESRGIAWAWQKGIGVVTVPDFFGPTVMAPPVRYLSDEPLLNAEVGRLEVLRRQSAPAEVDDDINECRRLSPGPGPLLDADGVGEEEMARRLRPAVIDDLTSDWYDALRAEASSVIDEKGFVNCFMESSPGGPLEGVRPGPAGENWSDVFEESVPAPVLIPVGDEQVSPEWQRTLNIERVIVDAVWQCTSGSYDDAASKLPGLVDRFEAEHAKAIDEAAASWDSVRRQAEQLGWSPHSPLAGFTPAPLPVRGG